MHAQIKDKLLNIKLIFIIIPFLFGLFYDFTTYLVATIFLGIILVMFVKNKKLKIYFNYCFISILTLTIFALLTCIWAVDKQDAIFGFFRILTVLLFTIILMQQDSNKIKEFYKVIPISGIIMLIICIIMKFIPNISEYFYSENGRLGGFFQYSNTFALFLLIGIITLMYSEERTRYNLLQIFILIIGILLTGSRTVFLLTLLVFVIYLFTEKDKKQKIKIFSILGITILVSLSIVWITNNFQTIGRYLTISLNSSTLWGRIIYYKDSVSLLKNNIFGYGYMGYSYIYPTVQTANYAVKFIHNDFLQIALDYGIIPMIIFVGTIIYNIFSKKTDKLQKIVLIIMFLHMMIDFDLQFLVMFFILIAMQDLSKQKNKEIVINKSIIILTFLVSLLFGYTYLGIASFANYTNKNELATSMLSNYTEAKVEILVSQTNLTKANTISNEILENNKYEVLAYNMKALYELEQGNYSKVCEYKEKAIELDKYNPTEYEEYVMLLSKILDKTVKENDEDNTLKYMKKVLEISEMIENTKNNTTGLANKIVDSSNIELNNQTIKYINNIKEVVEK